jgi:hypothetical protein
VSHSLPKIGHPNTRKPARFPASARKNSRVCRSGVFPVSVKRSLMSLIVCPRSDERRFL